MGLCWRLGLGEGRLRLTRNFRAQGLRHQRAGEGVYMGIDVNRERAIDLAVSQIEKQFGKGAIMKLGEEALSQDIPCLPTGSLGLDLALGIGGIPRGRVVERYGPESSGKTTLALQLVAEAQKRGGICAFIDAEHALD